MVNDNGELGSRNSFSAIGLEHKLGIHGSPTCVMEFSSAKGWLDWGGKPRPFLYVYHDE